jgi:hypothetical protein
LFSAYFPHIFVYKFLRRGKERVGKKGRKVKGMKRRGGREFRSGNGGNLGQGRTGI